MLGSNNIGVRLLTMAVGSAEKRVAISTTPQEQFNGQRFLSVQKRFGHLFCSVLIVP